MSWLNWLTDDMLVGFLVGLFILLLIIAFIFIFFGDTIRLYSDKKLGEKCLKNLISLYGDITNIHTSMNGDVYCTFADGTLLTMPIEGGAYLTYIDGSMRILDDRYHNYYVIRVTNEDFEIGIRCLTPVEAGDVSVCWGIWY